MSLLKLALRNIEESPFRSWAILICAALVAAFSVSSTLILRGAEQSMQLALQRLGADIMVVPSGSESKVENAILMGKPARAWMPAANLEKIAAIPGVAAASPQVYLSTLRGATCCSLPEMFLMAYDPASDFTLTPWLTSHLGEGLKLGDAVGGSFVYLPSGDDFIRIYGYDVTLKGNLEPTGTGLDQSMFLTFETAHEIARLSPVQAEQPLIIPEDSISAVLVKIEATADPQAIVREIKARVPAVTPIESASMFRVQRTQVLGLLRSLTWLLGVFWVLAIVLVGLLFSMAINDRRRHIGVLRALGSTRRFVLRSLLVEGGLLAAAGGAAGVALAALTIVLFRELIVRSLRVPFLLPSAGQMTLLLGAGMLLAFVSVAAGALVPIVRISMQDPAISMRE